MVEVHLLDDVAHHPGQGLAELGGHDAALHDGLGVAAADRRDDARLDEDAAVEHRGVRLGELDGRHRDALPERPVRDVDLRPVRGRRVAHETRRLIGEVDPGRLTEAHRGPRVEQILGRCLGRLAQAQRDLGRDHVARVRDRVLERHPAPGLVVGVVDMRPAVVDDELAGVLDLRLGRHGVALERGHGGHHLEHRARLVDAGHDGVDEPARVRRSRSRCSRSRRRWGSCRTHRPRRCTDRARPPRRAWHGPRSTPTAAPARGHPGATRRW